MSTAVREALISAFSALGDRVALVEGGEVVARGPGADLLPDPVLFAREPGAPARLIEVPDGQPAAPGAAPERRPPEGEPTRPRYLEVRAVAAGGAVAVVGRDVSERELLRLALARSDEILSLGSHELKGPLHVIGMICHLVETRAGRGEPIDRATLDRLRRQVTRLTRLLNELLDASRLQEGRMVLDVETLDLVELLQEQATLATAARAADLSLELPARARAEGDRARLGAVFFQLLDNAVRFTPPGTPIRVSLAEEPGGWRLVVADRGPGLSEAQAEHLFRREPPRQGDRSAHGLGLGLFVAAAAVRLHRGTLEYAPGAPRGAVFTVHLPR